MARYLKAALVLVVLILLSQSASAQYYMQYRAHRAYRQSPEVNNYLSARYDRLLQTNPRFRRYRMWKECHTITFPELRADCIASFDQYEPIIPS
jgi:hypothetical protein